MRPARQAIEQRHNKLTDCPLPGPALAKPSDLDPRHAPLRPPERGFPVRTGAPRSRNGLPVVAKEKARAPIPDRRALAHGYVADGAEGQAFDAGGNAGW
ncbi:hypothetical protein AQY21_23080 [Paracoccus sp. MKU1]|nr:hypothetical protein AQY21_23080 [Paracoccus sp. MKU1]